LRLRDRKLSRSVWNPDHGVFEIDLALAQVMNPLDPDHHSATKPISVPL